MSELSEFLLARIAEDEAVARLAPAQMAQRLEDQGEAIARRYGDAQPPEGDVSLADAMWWTAKDASAWIARHDPARVLAECEAKRRIVESARHTLFNDPLRRTDFWRGARDVADADLRFLALPYADHPDYDPEWRP